MAAHIGKHKPTRRIDRPATAPAGVASGEGSGFTAPPATPAPPAPTGLTLATALTYSAVTPASRITATWSGMESYDLETYAVQISTDPTFATDFRISTTAPNQTSISIDNLRTLTTYYVRVRTVVGTTPSDWSAAASITTGQDLVPPAAPSGQAGAFAGIGDFVITWTNPTSTNFRDVEISIYDSAAKTVLYATVYDATGRYIWTAAQNLAATSNAGDPSLYAELRSRSWGAVFSSAVNTGLITKAKPATPGSVSQSWSGDTGAAGADWSIAWAAQADAAYYLLNINSLGARRIANTTYTYTLDKNIADNGTADPTLSYSLVAVDGLGQSSNTPASGTATNAAPAAPSVAILGGAMSLLVATVSTTPAADFAAWEYVWKRDGTTVRTLESRAAEQQYELSGASDAGVHSWTCTVRQKDVFGQYSAATASSAVVLDALTTEYLRGALAYSDSDNNIFTPPASGTLAALKDGVTTSGGVVYAA